jgi:iron complex outermembrane receptor protein
MVLAAALLCPWPSAAATDPEMFSLEELMSINVIGASKYEQRQEDVAAAVVVITREDIRSFGWRTLDEALVMLPGVYNTYDRQYHYPGVRGFGLPGDYSTRLLITINGNRANDPLYDAAASGRVLPIDLDLVERIEFIPGPGGAVYGQNAMFGVVNIITRNGATLDGGEVSAGWRWPQATRHVRGTWGKRLENGFDVLLSTSAMRSRGEDLFFDFGDAGVAGKARRLDGERDEEFFVRIARDGLSVELTHGDRRKDDPTGVFYSDPLRPGQYQRDRITLVQAQYQGTLSDSLSYSLRGFAGRYRYDGRLFYDGDGYDYPAAADWQGAEVQLVSTALANRTLMFGLEYQRNSRLEQQVQDLQDRSNDYTIKGSGYRYGIYLQDEWRLSERLTSTVGLRLDRNDTTGTKLSPRVALIWQARPDTKLKALYGRAHRAPNAWEREFFEEGFQAANPTLAGETIDTLELVADHEVSRDFRLRASLYRWKLDRLIGLGEEPDELLPQYQNFGSVTARGMELSAHRVFTRGVQLRTSLSLQRLGKVHGVKAPNSPELLGKLHLSAPIPQSRVRIGYELFYDGARYNDLGRRVSGAWRSNLHLAADRWLPGLDVSLSVLNLFDKRYAHPGSSAIHWQPAFEQDGRSVRLLMNYRF